MSATLEKTRSGRLVPVAISRNGKPRNPVTLEFSYSDEEFMVLRAMDKYKTENRRPYPNVTDILAVFRSLGYRHPDFE